MKKQIILFLILNPIFTYAMENTSSLSSFSSSGSYLSTWFSSSQTLNESKLVLNLRENKNKFENQLKLDKWIERERAYFGPVIRQLFTTDDIATSPVKFLQYCYYQKFHKYEYDMKLEQLTDLTLRNKCQNAQIDGYSALSAAMLAKDVLSPYVQRNFIQKLINLDFKQTPKDIEVAELILYDSIVTKPPFKMALIHLLHPDSSAYWCTLQIPQDIKKLIALYLIEAIKKDEWPLPNTKQAPIMLDTRYGYPLF